MQSGLKWLDIPPVWLLGALGLAWAQAVYLGLGLRFGSWAHGLGTVLVVLGLGLIVVALWAFRRHATTPVPHHVPSVLITDGIFAWSRNPIYLGDVLILTGLILRWDAVLAVGLVPVFVWIITTRFIVVEEARCRSAFGAAFDAYVTRTRRWI